MPSMPTDLQAALYYEPLPEQYVRCTLCPPDCKIAPDGRGACGVRINHEGQLFTRVGNRMVSAEIDPIEKKPLFHFLLGSAEYSIATVGCNLRCRFCQNWVISQWPKLRKLVDRGEDTSSAVREHPASEWCAETEPPETCWGIGTQVVPSEREIAQEESLRDVYLGNVPMEEGVENTICPGCGTVVVRRWRLTVVGNRIRAGRCPDCSQFIKGRWPIGRLRGTAHSSWPSRTSDYPVLVHGF